MQIRVFESLQSSKVTGGEYVESTEEGKHWAEYSRLFQVYTLPGIPGICNLIFKMLSSWKGKNKTGKRIFTWNILFQNFNKKMKIPSD